MTSEQNVSDFVLIRASAGTGKTHQLTNRYLQLFSQGVPPAKILAATFTRKAAGEIFSRIAERLVEAAESEAGAKRLQESGGISAIDSARARALLVRFTQQLHLLRISTLDGFFAELALTLSRHLRLPPRWNLVEQPLQMETLALARLISESSRHDLRRLLQWLAKGESSRSVRDLLHRQIQQLYSLFSETDSAGVVPWQFARRALEWDGTTPVPGMLGDDELFPLVERLSQFAREEQFSDSSKMLKDAILLAASTAGAADWKGFMKSTLVKNTLAGKPKYNRKDLPQAWVHLLQRIGMHARAHQMHALVQFTEGAYDLLSRFDRHFLQTKMQARTFMFSDLPRMLERQFLRSNEENPDPAALRAWSDALAAVDHLLLDEFQDTSLAQWEILHPFVKRIVQRASPGSVLIVGDAKQSIYEWRGGVPELLDNLQQRIPELSATDLSVSRRSCQAVIDAVNQVFRNLDAHENLDEQAAELQRWVERFPPHATARSDLQGDVVFHFTSVDPTTKQASSTLEKAVNVVQRISMAKPNQQIAVLMNSNENVAEMVFLLQSAGIDAAEVGGGPLTDSAAVRILLSLLTVIDHPGHSAAVFHVWNSPLRTVIDPGRFGMELPETPPHERPSVEQVTFVAEALRNQLLIHGYGKQIAEWGRILRPYGGPREQQRMAQFEEMTYIWHNDWGIRTEAFRQRVRETRVAFGAEAEVVVMTVHQAKGLQFDSVVLCDLESPINVSPNFVMARDAETLRPTAICRYQSQDIQEFLPPELKEIFEQHAQRRLRERLANLYVAMTRAIHDLHFVLSPPSRGKPRKSLAGIICAALDLEPPGALSE